MSLYCWNFSNSALTSTCRMCITSSTVRDRHSTGKQNSSCNKTHIYEQTDNTARDSWNSRSNTLAFIFLFTGSHPSISFKAGFGYLSHANVWWLPSSGVHTLAQSKKIALIDPLPQRKCLSRLEAPQSVENGERRTECTVYSLMLSHTCNLLQIENSSNKINTWHTMAYFL